MVGVAQLVESWNVAPDVAGSSPVAHPIYFDFYAPVAQLDRVPDFESVGRRFESCRAHHYPQGEMAHARALPVGVVIFNYERTGLTVSRFLIQ